eukprot:scaffold4320_cov142-Skeletonema_menzelii.AAC.4
MVGLSEVSDTAGAISQLHVQVCAYTKNHNFFNNNIAAAIISQLHIQVCAYAKNHNFFNNNNNNNNK